MSDPTLHPLRVADDEPTFDVFLSHSARDKPLVERIAERLRRAGVEPWLDRWSLTAGVDWQREIAEAVERSRTCAVCVGAGDLGAWELQEVALALDRAAKDRDFRVFAVLLPGLEEPYDPTRLPHFLRTRTWVDFRRGYESDRAFYELVAAVKGLPSGPSVPLTPLLGATPYRGLQPFREEDEALFFGRDREVQRLVELLKGSRFLAVVGSSGSGKSSLVRAGLVPALRAGALPDAPEWTIRVLRPGPDPLGALAAHLVDLDSRTGMHATVDALRDRPSALHLASRLALVNRREDMRLLWVVDQLEEVFTLTHDERLRKAFLDNLLVAGTTAGGPCTVVATVRADFYAHIDAYPELAEQVAAHQFVVRGMEREPLRDVIEQPARLAGAEFESGLIATILDDVADQPNALPLLEHALLELWERRRGTMLTLEGYRESGGVRGAVATRAEKIYDSLDESRKTAARGVLLRLTQPGDTTEDTRRRATAAELVTAQGSADAVEDVVGRLATARMLTVSGAADGAERWVEVSHEALIRGWQRLRGWIDEDRAGLRVHRRLTAAADEWRARGRHESLLLTGLLLAEVEEWRRTADATLNQLEREFVDASVQRRLREERGRRRRRRLTVSVLVAGIALVGSLALWAAHQAGVARDQRDAALSRELAANASGELASDPELSLLLARAALARRSTPQAIMALRDALAQDHLRSVLGASIEPVNTARFDPSGRHVVTASQDGRAKIWDASSGRLLHVLAHDLRASEDVFGG